MLSGATVAVTARRNEGQKREREGAFREMMQCCREGQRNCERFRISPLRAEREDKLFEAHREVEGADMLGQGANGDVIDAGFSKFADGVERHVAGHLKLRLAVCAFDRFTHLLRVEVIEHDDVSPALMASSSSSSVSTSTSTGTSGCSQKAFSTA